MTTTARALARRLIDDLAGADFHRFPTSVAAAATFKQWVHVAVIDPAVTLIANFSAIAEPPGPAAHRLAVLIYGDEVSGHAHRFEPAECAMPAGRTGLVFGGNRLESAGDLHRLELDEPALALRAHLVLRAVAGPSVLHHLPVSPGGAFHWAAVPRLVATGTIERAGRTYELREAPAYRDRNWGSFRFGDVAWDWGYAAAPAGGPPCAVGFMRLLSAGRTRVLDQAILVWWRDRLLASFRGGEVGFSSAGAFDGPVVTVPPALALCRPGRATGVPEAVTVTGRSSRGQLGFRFARAQTARIVAPNDARLGTTAIYESFGEVRVTGRVEGEELAFAGYGFFEHVHG
jgi:hypothetical protein